MTPAIKLAVLIMASSVMLAPASPPRCIGDLITTESGARPIVHAPVVTPARGAPAARVTISGDGFGPSTRLTVAAVYGERNCVIEGLGDQYLGSVTTDARGSYSLSVLWPARFDPVLGRNRSEPRTLPRGRYYVFALPCAQRAACSFTAGTQPGGPFILGSARAAPALWIAVSALVSCGALGVIALKRRAR